MSASIKNSRIPLAGTYTDLYERLSNYISRFDKNWINEIKGAKKEDIDTLKHLNQMNQYDYHYPKAYEIYLNYMGVNDNGLLNTQIPGYASVSEIIESYEGIHEEQPETLSGQYIHFFQKELFDGQLSFDFTQIDNPQIVMTDEDSQFVSYFADNFEKFLFQCAFSKYEKLSYEECITFAGSSRMFKEALKNNNVLNVSDMINNFSGKYGFQKVWFSDRNHYIGFKEGISFYIDSRNDSLRGFIVGDVEQQFANISHSFLKELCVNPKN